MFYACIVLAIRLHCTVQYCASNFCSLQFRTRSLLMPLVQLSKRYLSSYHFSRGYRYFAALYSKTLQGSSLRIQDWYCPMNWLMQTAVSLLDSVWGVLKYGTDDYSNLLFPMKSERKVDKEMRLELQYSILKIQFATGYCTSCKLPELPGWYSAVQSNYFYDTSNDLKMWYIIVARRMVLVF